MIIPVSHAMSSVSVIKKPASYCKTQQLVCRQNVQLVVDTDDILRLTPVKNFLNAQLTKILQTGKSVNLYETVLSSAAQ